MMTNNPFSTRFNDEVSWAFRIFDIDNSGSIAVEEINDSVQVAFVVWAVPVGFDYMWLEVCEVFTLKVVWKILDGVGDAIDGTVEEISDFLFERLNKQAEGGEVKVLVHLISVFGCSIVFILTLFALFQVDEADFINFCAKGG